MPLCKVCNVEKPLLEFYIRNQKKQVATSYCKKCNKEKVKQWRKTPEGKVKFKAQDEKIRGKVKAWLTKERAKGCKKCNDIRPYVIDFHHLNPEEKTFTVGATNRWTKTQLEKELKKCCRLCANCHRLKTQQNNDHAPKRGSVTIINNGQLELNIDA